MTAPVSRVSTPQLKKSNPNSAQVGAQMQARGEKKGVRIKKKAPQILSGSAPAPGHRKAERKRIVLSNTNALNVPNVRELTLEDLGNAASETSVLNIPGQVVDQLRSVGAFKPNQSWSWFSHPAFLMRRETTELAQSLEGKATVRKVVVGPRSSGKTAYLLQAMTMALMKGWVVISIPDAHELTNATTPYGPLEGSDLYSHSAYTATLLSRIRDANLAVLDGLKVSQSYPGLRGRVTDGIALSELCEIGAIDPSAASAVFTILMEELTKPSSEQYPRPQLMFTMDGLPFTMQDTKYRSPSYEHIPAHHFQLVRFFHDVLSGKRALPNGGAVLAATSATNSPKTHDVEYAISTLEYSQQWESLLPTKFESRAHDPELNQELLRLSMSAQNETKGVPTPDLYSEAEDIAHEQFVRHIPPPSMSKYLHTARVLFDPFYKYNTHVLDVFGVPKNGDPPDRRQQHIHIQRLAGLSKAESKGILEYWTSSGMAGRAVVNEATVSAAWTMAGSGMIGLMEKGVLGRPRALHS